MPTAGTKDCPSVEHGDGADLVAVTRADERLEKGGLDGSAVWKRVPRAIEARTKPREGEAVHWPVLETRPDGQA